MKHYAGAQLRSRLKSFAGALRDLKKAPGGEDALHDMRVASRRFQQAVRLFEDFLDPKDCDHMLKRVRRLMKRCGAVRNCDVALKLFEAVNIQDPELLATLARDRAKRLDSLETELDRWHGRDTPSHWRSELRPHHPRGSTWDASLSMAENAYRVLPALAEELFDEGATAVANENKEELHRFRLHCKRFRYSLELFEDVYGSAFNAHLQKLRKLQSHLGGINDCVVTLEKFHTHLNLTVALNSELESRRRAFLAFWKQFAREKKAWTHWLKGPDQNGDLRSTTRRGRAA